MGERDEEREVDGGRCAGVDEAGVERQGGRRGWRRQAGWGGCGIGLRVAGGDQ